AAILPGNVMMVYGGWEIDSQSQKKKRQAAASSSLRFFNLTSMSWVPSYNSADVPKKNPGAPDAPDASQASKSKSIKLGLGLGLGLGMGLVIIAGCIAVFCCLRSKKRREKRSRDSAAQAMAQDAAYFNENDEMLERDDYSSFTAGWYGNQAPQHQQQQQQPPPPPLARASRRGLESECDFCGAKNSELDPHRRESKRPSQHSQHVRTKQSVGAADQHHLPPPATADKSVALALRQCRLSHRGQDHRLRRVYERDVGRCRGGVAQEGPQARRARAHPVERRQHHTHPTSKVNRPKGQIFSPEARPSASPTPRP
ncbi:hypothetical protein Golomagni_06559, partial [Golovinomyces magnicellulatus]